MHRVVVTLFVALLLGQVSGLASAAEEHCVEACDDGGDDSDAGDCPPACASCACAAQRTLLVLPDGAPLLVAEDAGVAGLIERERSLASTDPTEIWHVPKSHLG